MTRGRGRRMVGESIFWLQLELHQQLHHQGETMRSVLAVFAAAFLTSASHAAQPINRCIGPAGEVTFTQSACPRGTALTKVTQVPIEVARVPERTWQDEARRTQEVLRPPAPQARGHADGRQSQRRLPDARDRQRERCADARTKVGENRAANPRASYDQLRAWDEYIALACKGL